MANPIVYRGYVFQGIINLKMDDGTSPQNVLPYVIPGGSVVKVLLPKDLTLLVPVQVVLSSDVALPSPLTGNEVTIVNAATGQISFTGIGAKSSLMGVGTNLEVDVLVIKDPSTLPNPVNVDAFRKQKTIDVADLGNV
ncbi:MAG: hypothetical protein IPQ08_06150 [Chitinophagaceae bacterium]|nr:hypothetical protein [Chitinophagaceae bacterium]